MSFDIIKKFICSLYDGTSRRRGGPPVVGLKTAAGVDCSFRENCRNAVHCEVPSKFTQKFLVRNDLLAKSRNQPETFIKDLETCFQAEPSREILLALAEMCFLYGKEPSDNKTYFFLASAFYSYKFLFDQTDGAANPYASSFQLARELYNHALSRLLNLAMERRPALGSQGILASAAGPMELRLLRNELPWAPERYDECHSVYDFQPFGFLSDWRQEGVGVPMICARRLPDNQAERVPEELFLPPWQVHAATGFLRFDNLDVPAAPGAPPRQVGVEFHDPMKSTGLEVDGKDVPLEIDFTSTLAFAMGRGSFIKNLSGLLTPEIADEKDALSGIYSYLPYDRSKTPVVFIHGQAASPRAWDQMFNALLRNPRIRANYQFCFFFYRAGDPIAYSAQALRRSLLLLRRTFDPDGGSAPFNRMALVGHSLGGLLAKCCVCSSGGALVKELAGKDLGELKLDPGVEALVKDILVFEPLPFVRRVVYIATPHQGCGVDINFLSPFASALVDLPQDLRDKASLFLGGLGADSHDAALLRQLDGLPRGPGTSFHSIIGNVKADDADDMTDSVVPYQSSHLGYAASEKIIRSNHFAHKHPAAILEVERILVEALSTA